MDTEVFVFDKVFYEAIVCFEIQSEKCCIPPHSLDIYRDDFGLFHVFFLSYGQRENRREEVESLFCKLQTNIRRWLSTAIF